MLKTMCSAPYEGKAYFRPFICSGDYSSSNIFLVGINPATPVFPDEMGLDEYVNMLLDYNKFMEFYKSSRTGKGKDEISRTRIGMKSFIYWLMSHTDSSVLETDIIPYPTESVKHLKKEPKEIIERGKKIFQ